MDHNTPNTLLAASAKVELRNCEVSRVVLRHVGGFEPFATHIEVFPEDRPSFFVHGHYFEELEPATLDFGGRALRDLQQQTRELEQDSRLISDLRAL